jgi:hypothetical protein
MEQRLYFVSSPVFRFTATPCICCRKLHWTSDGDISGLLLYVLDLKMAATSGREEIPMPQSVLQCSHLFGGKNNYIQHTHTTFHQDDDVEILKVTFAGRSRIRFPMVSSEIFYLHNPSCRTMALGSTQPLTEMSTRNISSGVKAAGAYGWQPYHLHVSTVLKSGSLTLLEPSGPVQACNGIVLPILCIFLGTVVYQWPCAIYKTGSPVITSDYTATNGRIISEVLYLQWPGVAE